MSQLPTGVVTFLFTDIEGSTRLLQDLGAGYSAAHAEHAAIIREAIAEAGGVEVSTEGDSFFVAFSDPVAALRAAVSAQRGLASHPWPDGAAIRVRIGVHTGEGTLGGANYLGLDVHRGARIAAAGHGGQILLSDTTRSLVERSLPEGAALRDLGEHRLKDLDHPEHLFDLSVEGLISDFPPLRSLDARPNNLPPQLTSFVGREEQIEEVQSLLSRTRLLTLTGPGGTGKTRLALQVASAALTDHTDGAFFVDLSAVADPAVVPSALARALGIRDESGRPVLDALADHLRERDLLLVVDNFEQVTEAAGVVETLLAAAPRLTVLVTSRAVLSIQGEHEYLVPPLEPADPDRLPDLPTLRRLEAVRLFTERAGAVVPGFEVNESNASAVAGITARLDGLPLAIELAATRTKVLSPQQMLERLASRLAILSSRVSTLPQRQRTLRDAIAWSYDLLDDPEQRLFEQLSVFSGGWTLAAAEAVCEPDALGLDAVEGLTSLVDKSLIRRSGADLPGEPRFSMLETIREFGQERLESRGDLDLLLRRHGEHFLGLAMEAEPHLTAADQVEWLDRCEQEHANIRAALRWALETRRHEGAQDAAAALWRFWQQRGHLAEAARWFAEALAAPSGAEPHAARARALMGAGGIAWWQQDRDAAGGFYREAVDLERRRGDPRGTAEALYNLAFIEAGEDIDTAGATLRESVDLFRQVGDERGVAQALAMLVIGDAQAGRWEKVQGSLQEAVAIWHRLGDRLHLAFDLLWLGFANGRLGRRKEARAAALESLGIFREVDNRTGIGITFTTLSFLATWEGRHADAIRLAGAADTVRERVGGPPGGFAGILEGDVVAEAGSHLSPEEATRAWEEGRAMSLDQALTLATAVQPA